MEFSLIDKHLNCHVQPRLRSQLGWKCPVNFSLSTICDKKNCYKFHVEKSLHTCIWRIALNWTLCILHTKSRFLNKKFRLTSKGRIQRSHFNFQRENVSLRKVLRVIRYSWKSIGSSVFFLHKHFHKMWIVQYFGYFVLYVYSVIFWFDFPSSFISKHFLEYFKCERV